MHSTRHCDNCGKLVAILIPPGDNRPRHVCHACGRIQYQNPKVVCGCIPIWQSRILLCKRAIEPKYGLWTLPAGFMENDETIWQGAARETMEEAGAEITDQTLYRVYSLPRANQVYIMFRAMLTGEKNYAAGTESLAVRLFTEDEIPWDEIAFRVIHRTLKSYFADRKTGNFAIISEDIE